MKDTTCRFVQEKLSSNEAEALEYVDRILVESHMETCDDCRDFARVSASLNRVAPGLAPAPLPPLVARRTILSALDGTMPERRAPRRLSYRFAVVGISAAVVALALVAAIFGAISQEEEEAPAKTARTGAPAKRAVDAPKGALTGSFIVPLEGAKPLELQENRVWGTADAQLSIEEKTESRARIRLKRGKIVAEVNSRDLNTQFVVLTPSAHIEVRGTIFTVVVDDDVERVRVIEGQVAVTDFASDGKHHLLSVNQELIIGQDEVFDARPEDLLVDLQLTGMQTNTDGVDQAEPGAQPTRVAREKPKVTPIGNASRALLRQAKNLRGKKRFIQAKQTYLRLMAEYPSSSAAANATVALAQMELGVLNDKTAALGHFEDYLKRFPSGVLADEAWIGRVRTLAQLSRHRSVIAASSAYLKERPQGAVAPEMTRRRGDAHVEQGKCQAALLDYERVMTNWPESKEAKRARTGTRVCKRQR
jgi:hypothetical protein